MTNDVNHSHRATDDHVHRGVRWRWSLVLKRTAAITAVLGLAVAAAGCGSSNGPSSSTTSGGATATALAYTKCMRSHGVQDFPDPSGSGNFDISAKVGGDPAFTAATHACRSLSPGGQQAQAVSAKKLATEVKWARCMRSHGVPGFPDPNSSGQIDSAKFNPQSPAFGRASAACQSLQPSGAVSVAPGAP
jgi:hypothetical protein